MNHPKWLNKFNSMTEDEFIDMLREKQCSLIIKEERQNKKGNETSILHMACEMGKEKIVECLIYEHGLDVNQRSRKNKQPMQIAITNKYNNIVALLLGHPCFVMDYIFFIDAFYNDNYEAAEMLISNWGCNVNDPVKSPLMSVVTHGTNPQKEVEIARLIMSHPNFDINYYSNRDVLEESVIHDKPWITELMLKDTRIETPNMEKLIRIATVYESHDVLEMLKN